MAPEAHADPAMSLTRVLRLRHQAMMNRNLDQRLTFEELDAFMGELVEAGVSVPAGRDRDRLRNMLFFWAAERSSRGSTAAGDEGRATNSSSPTGPHSALPELKPYRASTSAKQAMIGPGQPIRPSDFAERELSDEELSELIKTRTQLRFAALARQYKASTPRQRKGYLLSDRALEEARSVMDCDPDIRALVEESDGNERAKKRIRWAAFGLGILALVAAIYWYLESRRRVAEAENLRLKAENQVLEVSRLQQAQVAQAVLKEKADLLAELRGALRRIELGDPEKLRVFMEVYGDATTEQRASIVARTKTESSIILQLKAAVDALEAGDAGPVINLAREIAAPAANGKRAEVELAAKTPTLPPSKVERPALPAPTAPDTPSCKGWLWLGSEQRPLISGGPLRALSPGTPVTLSTGDEDVRLRSNMPKPNYAIGPAIGLVAANSEVQIISPLRAYRRPNGLDQVWAEVRTARPFCTQIFIQYAGSHVYRLSQMRDAFLAKGYDVQPPQQQLGAAKGKAEVRYYHDEDASAAQIIAKELTQLAGGRQVRVSAQADDVPSGRLEILIDLGLVR